jgi:hypothetical protein
MRKVKVNKPVCLPLDILSRIIPFINQPVYRYRSGSGTKRDLHFSCPGIIQQQEKAT